MSNQTNEAPVMRLADIRDVILCAATSLESSQPLPWHPMQTQKLRDALANIEADREQADREAAEIHTLLDEAGVPRQHDWLGTLRPVERILHPQAADTDLVWRVRQALAER